MKVAIVGMGVAGSYLSARLSEEHKVTCFERFREDNFDCVCAWGTSKNILCGFAKSCGLSFEDYVVHDGKTLYVDMGGEVLEMGLKGLCTYDKHGLVRDTMEGQAVHFGRDALRGSTLDDFDLVIDATGLSRPLLPRIKRDFMIPTVQYKVKYQDPPLDDFYVKPLPGWGGYFWLFPLGGGYAHVGAGDYHRRHNAELQAFLKAHPCEVIKKVGRPIRIAPPSLCEPFYSGKVVGVGEAIGTVFPFLGEGIIPSLQCADLLVENLEDLPRYRRSVLKKFGIYDTVYRLVRAKMDGDFSVSRHMLGLISLFFHMRLNEGRYGMKVRMAEMLRLFRSE